MQYNIHKQQKLLKINKLLMKSIIAALIQKMLKLNKFLQLQRILFLKNYK